MDHTCNLVIRYMYLLSYTIKQIALENILELYQHIPDIFFSPIRTSVSHVTMKTEETEEISNASTWREEVSLGQIG